MRCYLRGIEADPVVETFHVGLMRCYERSGRLTEAISAYRRMRQVLSVVLGIQPSVTSQGLYRRLLETQTANGVTSAGDPVEIGSVSPAPAWQTTRRAAVSARQQTSRPARVGAQTRQSPSRKPPRKPSP